MKNTSDVDNQRHTKHMKAVYYLANCNYKEHYKFLIVINNYAMLFSIPFMVLTSIIYLSIPELRNQHGKSLACYLMSLSIGYLMLYSTTYKAYITYYSCKIIGML